MNAIRLALLGAILVAGARDASAGPKKLKGQFLCGVFVDGKITKPLAASKTGKLTETIACAMHLDDAAELSHSVTVRTLRKGTELSSVTGVVNESADKRDFEVYLKPSEAFKPCEDFDIAVSIFDPGGQYAKTIKVQQGCPAPAPIKAQLTCGTEYGDGTPIKFPKTKKLQGRLEKPINCTIYAKSVPDGTQLTGTVWVKGKTPHKNAMADTAPEGQKVDVQLDPDADFESCAGKFSVLASLVDATGAERWTGKLDIPAQFCPD